jgi:phage shock protein C
MPSIADLRRFNSRRLCRCPDHSGGVSNGRISLGGFAFYSIPLHAYARWNFLVCAVVYENERRTFGRSGEAQNMICTHCQREIADYSNFCYFCGMRQSVSPDGLPRASRKLRRSATDRKIAGVCGGIAEYFEIDSTIVRLIWVLAVIMPVPLLPAFIGYFVAWLVMPDALPVSSAPQRPVIIPNPTQPE